MLDDTQEKDGQVHESGNGNTRLVLWLIVMSISFLVIPVFLTGSVIQEERMMVEEQLAGLQAELDVTPPVDPQIERLESELLTLRNSTSDMESLQTTLQATNIDWTTIMLSFLAYDPNLMELTAITQTDRRIIVNGRADDESDLMAYVDVLRDSGLFAQVILQSINRTSTQAEDEDNHLLATRLVAFVIQIDLEEPEI